MNSLAIFIILGVVGLILFLNFQGTLSINKTLDNSIQNLSENFKDFGNSVNKFVTETSTILRKTIEEHLELVQLTPINGTFEDINGNSKDTFQNNHLNPQPVIDKSKLEKIVHQLTNQYRLQFGLPSLSLDEELSKVARNHSQDMALRNYFSHQTPEGLDPTDRANILRYKCEKVIGQIMYIGIAENIFQNNLAHTIWYTAGIPTSYDWNSLDDIAQSTVDGWMNSLGHRKNILTETFDRQGIGVEIAQNGKVYITQNFC